MSPAVAVTRARKEFGQNIAVEGGANFIHDLLAAGCIDELRLSITPITGGEDKIMIHELTKFFAKISEEEKMGVTHFFTCIKPITNPK